MRPEHVLRIGLTYFFCLCLFACNNTSIDDEQEDSELLQAGEVRIKAYPNDLRKISFAVVAEKITIDWGDGMVEDFTPDEEGEEFTHEYANQNQQNILIRTEKLRAFVALAHAIPTMTSIIGNCGSFEEIHFGKSPSLESVILRYHDLNRFVFDEVNALTSLDCSFNGLSASALNQMFQSLPNVPEGVVIYRENTGSEDCDFSIAQSKGWAMKTYLPGEGPTVSETDDETLIRAAASYFSDFATFLKLYYLTEGLYSHTIDLTGYSYTSDYTMIYNHEVVSANSHVLRLWTQTYTTINRLNAILYMMSKRTNKDFFSDYIYTAKALRSHAYFILVNLWGDVPYADEKTYGDVESVLDIQRMDKDLLLDMLLEQLVEAEAHLPETEAANVVSKAYTRLLLAKIYTFKGNTARALEYTESIINSGKYRLSSDDAVVFEGDNSGEAMTPFFVTYNTSEQKWEELIRKGKQTPYARYAEVLLLAAENYLKISDMQRAVNALNPLRSRNGRSPANAGMLTSTIEDMIQEEYALDLGNEGLYFFVLKRFGKAEKVLEISSFRLLFPIPQHEIDQNPALSQNEGY